MSDTELTDDEEQRLCSMLRRAADGLEAPSAPTSLPVPSGRARRPWLAAAALVAVAAVGTAWWSAGRDGGEIVNLVEQLDEPVLLEVIEDEGLWRLPAPDGELELVGIDLSAALQGGRLIAVDDPAAPTAWIAVLPGQWGPTPTNDRLADPPGEVPSTVGAGVNLIRTGDTSPTGSSWFGVSLVEAELGSNEERHLTFAAGGVAADRVFEMLTTMVDRFDPPEGPWPVIAALDSLTLPDELVHDWNDVAVGPARQLVMTVEQRDGRPAMFTLTDSGSTPAVASLLERVSLEALDLSGATEYRSVLRPDIGPGAFTFGATGAEQLVVFSSDGVSLNVAAVAEEDPRPMPDPLSFGRQIELIDQLRPVTEDEVLAEIERIGGTLDIGTMDDAVGGPGS